MFACPLLWHVSYFSTCFGPHGPSSGISYWKVNRLGQKEMLAKHTEFWLPSPLKYSPWERIQWSYHFCHGSKTPWKSVSLVLSSTACDVRHCYQTSSLQFHFQFGKQSEITGLSPAGTITVLLITNSVVFRWCNWSQWCLWSHGLFDDSLHGRVLQFVLSTFSVDLLVLCCPEHSSSSPDTWLELKCECYSESTIWLQECSPKDFKGFGNRFAELLAKLDADTLLFFATHHRQNEKHSWKISACSQCRMMQ
jgi:hypothetical protein